MSSNLAKNSILTLLANLSFSLTNWLLLVVIAKVYDAAFLGQFVLALSILSPVFLLSSLKLRTLIVVDVDTEYSLEQYLGTRLLLSSIGLILSILLGISFFNNVSFSLLLLIGVYKWCDSWCELFYAYYHRIGRFDTATFSQCGRSVLSMSVILIIALISDSAILMVSGWVATTVVFSIVDTVIFTNLRRRGESVSTNWISLLSVQYAVRTPLRILKQYYTLSISLVVGALFVYIPNFVIEKYSGIEAAGEFAAVSYFLIAGGLLIHSVSQASSPRLAVFAKQENWKGLITLTFKMCLIGAAIGVSGVIVALVAGKFFLELFYNPEIALLSEELTWVLVAAAIRYIYIFIGTAMNALKQFHTQTYIYAVGTLCVLVACLFWVPEYGSLGAAKAMVFATCMECILFGFFFWRNVKIKEKAHD